ncbi:MAG TPA: hypothetical protein P5295_12220 [Spirochaetota bacterium]|nr:hypothetical protein [Spirochaetota bacterium]
MLSTTLLKIKSARAACIPGFALKSALLCLIFSSGALANIDYMQNQSADFFLTLSRNAATDSADAVNYNPAGTALMKDGLYVQLANQSAFINYSIKHQGDTYRSEKPEWLIPNAYVIYKKGKFSVFGGFTIPAGGGTLNYKNGVPMMPIYSSLVRDEALKEIASTLKAEMWDAVQTTTGTDGDMLRAYISSENHVSQLVDDFIDLSSTSVAWEDGSITGSSMYLAGTVGGAYRFNNYVSLSVGLRYMHVVNSYKGFSRYRVNPGATAANINYPDGLDPLTLVELVHQQFIDQAVDGTDAGDDNQTGEDAGLNDASDEIVNLQLDATTTADGIGGIVGLDIVPFEDMVIGLRLETPTFLSFVEDVHDNKDFGGMFVDGRVTSRDLPMLLGVGLSYSPIRYLGLYTSFNFYFTTLSDRAGDRKDEVISYDDDYGTGIDACVGIEGRIKWFRLGFGYMYADPMGNSKTYNDLEYALRSHTIAGGINFTYDFTGHVISTTFSLSKNFFEKGKSESGDETFNKDIWTFAIGLEYRYHGFSQPDTGAAGKLPMTLKQ